jgi:hypothetical protein
VLSIASGAGVRPIPGRSGYSRRYPGRPANTHRLQGAHDLAMVDVRAVQCQDG